MMIKPVCEPLASYIQPVRYDPAPITGWSCKNYKKKCCKKYKKGDQCRRCPKLAIFDELVRNYYLEAPSDPNR